MISLEDIKHGNVFELYDPDKFKTTIQVILGCGDNFIFGGCDNDPLKIFDAANNQTSAEAIINSFINWLSLNPKRTIKLVGIAQAFIYRHEDIAHNT